MAKYVVSRTDGTPIPDDEPCFIIRAKDAFAVRAVNAYLELTRDIVTDEMTQEIWSHRERIAHWQIDNRGRVKIPD